MLKRWADHYPFTAEVKGSATTIRPKQIIVTSNYHPDEIWPEDKMMKDAVMRRFKFVNFIGPMPVETKIRPYPRGVPEEDKV